MRRASTFAAVLAAAAGLLLADAVSAQSNPHLLSWPGRGEATPPQPGMTEAPTRAARDLRRPNPVIPHGGAAAVQPAPRGLTPAPGPVRRTLTPANAWLRPPAPAPVTAPSSVAPPPGPAPAPARPGPEYLPDQGGRGQPAPAVIVYPAAPPPAEPAPAMADPMAPRRDAPIFRIKQEPPPPATPPSAAAVDQAPTAMADAPPTPRTMQAAPSGEAPPRARGGRYYSVHRQFGRDPDPLTLPEPTYVDGLVVSDIDTIASQDLAAPQEGPTLIRDRNGNLRAAPAPSDGDHQ